MSRYLTTATVASNGNIFFTAKSSGFSSLRNLIANNNDEDYQSKSLANLKPR